VNVWRLIKNLERKLSIEVIAAQRSTERKGKTYRIFDMSVVLSRRKEAGYTHVFRNRNGVELVRIDDSHYHGQASAPQSVQPEPGGIQTEDGCQTQLGSQRGADLSIHLENRIGTQTENKTRLQHENPFSGTFQVNPSTKPERTGHNHRRQSSIQATASPSASPSGDEIADLEPLVGAYLTTTWRSVIGTPLDPKMLHETSQAIGTRLRLEKFKEVTNPDNPEPIRPRRWAYFKSVAINLPTDAELAARPRRPAGTSRSREWVKPNSLKQALGDQW
jgi:hypothetical protein